MLGPIIIALIAAVPPTIGAYAALRQTRRLQRPLDEVNRAVNHRAPGEPTLVQMVSMLAADIADVRHQVARHQAWHQVNAEEDDR